MAKPSPKHAGDPTLQAIGQIIRDKRTALGLSQEALANSIEIDRSYMGGIERGEHNLTVMNLKRIADQFGVPMSELLRDAAF